jgi:hypothetical protein
MQLAQREHRDEHSDDLHEPDRAAADEAGPAFRRDVQYR